MRKLIFFLVFFYALCAMRYTLVYAEDNTLDAVTKLIAATNERLQTENAELNNKTFKLEVELKELTRAREAIFEKLKIITVENSKLKDQVTTLQTGILNLDNDRNQKSQVINSLTEKIAQLEKGEVPEEPGSFKPGTGGQRNETQPFKKEISIRQKKELEASLKESEKQKNVFRKELMQKEETIGKLKEEKKALEKELKITERKTKDAALEVAILNKNLEGLKKETANAHYNLGVIFQEKNREAEAIKEYEMVLALKPDDKDAHYNLALLYDNFKNDREKAIVHYQKYLGIKPDAVDAQAVKERIDQLNIEQKVWGSPQAKGLGDKEKLGRFP